MLRLLRIFWMSAPCTAIALWTTNRTRGPCPLSGDASLALESTLEALSGLFFGTRFEADLPDLLCSFLTLFHRKAERIHRELRTTKPRYDVRRPNKMALKRLMTQALSLVESRKAFAFFRDCLAELYAAETGSVWRFRSAPPQW